MDEVTKLGRDAAAVLASPSFKKVAEEIRDSAFKAFCGEDDEKALEARRERQAFERIIAKLTRLQSRGSEREKVTRKAVKLQE